MSLEYLITSLIVILLPGTGVIYTLAFGLSRGWRASVLAAFGCTLGIVPHIAASIVGLAALLHTSALAFQIVKYLGVAYLIYMAYGVLREGGALDVKPEKSSSSAPKIIVSGFLLNILNPKLSLFFLAFLPQFVPAGAANATAQMLVLAAIFMALTFVVFVGYGAFASATRRHVISRPAVMRWLKRGFAGAFGALGLRLALAER
ncbi:LysE family translocator [Hoeflea prorocentri]|uniref:LysE family translocator n=1 Tax=Hoeflea prorocentri TaxID=1922333 RepID=A0A9X3UL93_9HYPH|nr:LysE family translocator [Hoeflea prorocentri]MCY6382490.1 LysE family translocator [Hoeflea prorocentri]MDA5400290.1 LysE family translocator [Hoeflea prorocentri]